jgi:hypothetical protein
MDEEGQTRHLVGRLKFTEDDVCAVLCMEKEIGKVEDCELSSERNHGSRKFQKSAAAER